MIIPQLLFISIIYHILPYPTGVESTKVLERSNVVYREVLLVRWCKWQKIPIKLNRNRCIRNLNTFCNTSKGRKSKVCKSASSTHAPKTPKSKPKSKPPKSGKSTPKPATTDAKSTAGKPAKIHGKSTLSGIGAKFIFTGGPEKPKESRKETINSSDDDDDDDDNNIPTELNSQKHGNETETDTDELPDDSKEVAGVSVIRHMKSVNKKLKSKIRRRILTRKPEELKDRPYYSTELDVNAENGLLDSLFEGDLLLSDAQARTISQNYNWEEITDEPKGHDVMDSFMETVSKMTGNKTGTETKRNKRHLGKGVVQQWPSDNLGFNVEIPYKFAQNVSVYMRGLTVQAMQQWADNTCIRWKFDPDGKAKNRIHIVAGKGCYSHAGFIGGEQLIVLNDRGCNNVGFISHQLGHSLGLLHEQNRPDRDEFIKVSYNDINPSLAGAFAVPKTDAVNSYGIPYDFGSIMHFDGWTRGLATSKRSYSVLANDQLFQKTMGQRVEPSFADYKQINRAYCTYSCPSSRTQGHPSLGCQHSGYEDPNACGTCKCPDGFRGERCDRVKRSWKVKASRNHGNTSLARSKRKTTEQISRITTRCGGTICTKVQEKCLLGGTYDKNQQCDWLLRAPEGYQIKVQMVSTLDFMCTEPCQEDYVELQTGAADFGTSGARLCCTQKVYDIFTSKANEFKIKTRSRRQWYAFKLWYWLEKA